MSRVMEEGLVLVLQRQFGTNQVFSVMTSLMVAVSSGVGAEATGTVMAALPEVPAGFQCFLSGIMGQEVTEEPLHLSRD